PLVLGAHITLSTSGGTIKLTLPAGANGIQVTGDGAAVMPDPAAPLLIDGASAGNVGMLFALPAGAAASVGNVTVQKTQSDGIRVTGGTVNVGPGVTVTGTALSGLRVTNGRAKVSVAAGQAITSFTDNVAHGIIAVNTG